jgi:hypothetical protein|tara:strand:+ start:5167 stop:5520 length:354 start_codon:yes stop_codon:yes gene_type:complete
MITAENCIEFVEKTYPKTCEAFKEIQQQDYELFCKKQFDYGPGNISLGSNLENPEDVRASLCGITFRVSDKVQRLINMIVKKSKIEDAANEPVMDSFQDLSNFGIIARIVKNGKWCK